MHLTHPIIATVDDHEFADGAWRGRLRRTPSRTRRAVGGTQGGGVPGAVGVAAPADARPGRSDALLRSRPIRRPCGAVPDRHPLAPRPADRPAPDGRPDATPSSEPSRARGSCTASESTAHWRILGNGSCMTQPWNDRACPSVRDAGLIWLKLMDPDVTGPDPDQWDGYPFERGDPPAHLDGPRRSRAVRRRPRRAGDRASRPSRRRHRSRSSS